MINQTQFEFIKKKYGHYASWAIWADEGEKPKDNVGDLSILDIDSNAELLNQLNPNVILIRNFKNEFRIFKIPHYSNYTGKEKYREEVKSILGFK